MRGSKFEGQKTHRDYINQHKNKNNYNTLNNNYRNV